MVFPGRPAAQQSYSQADSDRDLRVRLCRPRRPGHCAFRTGPWQAGVIGTGWQAAQAEPYHRVRLATKLHCSELEDDSSSVIIVAQAPRPTS